jgi:(p)ppGpp synthase/HD superfamily hydrolase
MIRFRKEAADAKNKASDYPSEQASPSLKWIPDVIALRVVLRAIRLSPLEDDESLRTREKMLCYYAMQIVREVWPASARNEAKDYIKQPKPNG